MSKNGEKNSGWFFYKGQKIQTWTYLYSERMRKKQIEDSNNTVILESCWDKMGNLIDCL